MQKRVSNTNVGSCVLKYMNKKKWLNRTTEFTNFILEHLFGLTI